MKLDRFSMTDDAPHARRRHQQTLFTSRILFCLLMVMICFGVLVARLYWLQIHEHSRFTTLSDANRIKLRAIPPTRGLIFDRNGVLLAQNIPSFHLELTPADIDDLAQTLAQLRQHIPISETDEERFRRLAQQTQKRSDGIPIRLNLTDQEMAKVGVELHHLSGVDIQGTLTRYYPFKEQGGHVLGYVARISKDDLQYFDKQGTISEYSGLTHIGKRGVEGSFEAVLRGQVGYEQVETNPKGRVLRTLHTTPPKPGQNIFLTLDIRLQALAEQILGDYNGSIIALDPQTGDVLAMANNPRYDINLFTKGISNVAYQALLNSPDKPFVNRALQGEYPPGSTIKPMIGLAGMEYGLSTRYSTTYCGGYYQLEGSSHRYRDWKKSGHGAVTLQDAIRESCDVYYYALANSLGITRMTDFLKPFGLGQATGIDLVGESTGLAPTPAWKMAQLKKPWYAGETVIAGIGQGYWKSTPMQIVYATSRVAMKGKGYVPHILHATQDPISELITPNQAIPAPPIVLKDQSAWDYVIAGMTQVVHSSKGTAYKSIGKATTLYQMAGKTGTAQVKSIAQNAFYDASRLEKRHHDHAWFIAFAPVTQPKIAVVVLAENGGSGSGVAAPMAKQLIDAFLSGLSLQAISAPEQPQLESEE